MAGSGEAPGRLATRLNQVIERALHEVGNFPPSKFAELLGPEVTEAVGGADALREYCSQVVEQIVNNVRLEIGVIVTESDVVRRLNRLDAVVAAQTPFADGTRAPPPASDSPADAIRTLVAAVRAAEARRVTEELRELEARNEALRSELVAKRHRVREIVSAADENRAAVEAAHKLAATWQPPAQPQRV